MHLPSLGLAALFIVVLPHSASGQETVRLDDLLEAGLSNSHRIASLELSVRAAGSAAEASGYLPDPMASLMVQPLPVYTARGAQRSVWRAEQRYTWRDARSAERDAADWNHRAAEASVLEAGYELRYRISSAYLTWYARAQERVAIEHYTGVLEEIEDAATLQYEVGAGPQQSILKAQIEKNRLRRRLVQLDVDVAGVITGLEQLVGIRMDDAVPVLPDLNPTLIDSTALLADPALNRMRATKAGLEAQARLAGTKSRPDLTFSVQLVDVADSAFRERSSALGYNWSLAVGVGMIAMAGLAAETAVVMQVYLDEAVKRFREEGRMVTITNLRAALEEGAVDRVRPKLMTVLTTIIGLLPVMIGAGTGSEIMRRIAAPMVGGLVSSTLLTLVVIPALYVLYYRRKEGVTIG